MTSKSKTANASQYLLIKLQHIQYRVNESIKDFEFVYFSFSIGDRLYFSSCMDSFCPVLSDDIVIPIQSQLPQTINLHRWQNHMIMFTHQIDISELKTRTTTKKKHETKAGQILSFMVMLLTSDELKFGDKYVQSISQHYFIIQQMSLKEKKTQNRADVGPSYYLIRTSGFDYVMPILDGQICIKLPQTLQFQHIKNGKSVSKSKQYNSDELKQNNIQIQLKSENGENQQLILKVKWGINFFESKAENSLLLQAHQLIIYDIEVKFDNYNQFANSRVKFVYGNKAFQVGNQFNTAKPAKIKKIIYFIIKSEDEQVTIIVQRNLKIVAQSKFYTDQITSYTVHTPKRKLLDDNGKNLGLVKFKCEKAKNLSTPNNNKFWKQSNKKKLLNTILLSVQQISVNYEKDEPLCVVIKSQTQQRVVNNVPNFLFFDKQLQISYAPLVVEAKGDDNVYMMVKNQQNVKNNQGRQSQGQNDFIGIAILNFAELRLGANSTEISFFKNQGKTATVNCLINKVASYPFVKSTFQPQILNTSAHKTMALSVFMKKVVFTPYFYTYRYDNKDQVYCIVEANRLKKVLIMQSTIHDQLTFIPSSSSDSLNFYIQDSQYIKVKVTFLVSDVGQQQEIYGFAVIKMKIGQLSGPQGLKFNKVQLKNQFGNDVGQISIEVYQGSKNSNKFKQKKQPQIVTGPFKSDIKRVQNDLNKINQSMEVMQQSIKKKNNKYVQPSPLLRKSEQIPINRLTLAKQAARYDNSINYAERRKQRNHSVAGSNNDSIKLPYIKQNRKQAPQKNNLKDLVNMMKIRKRNNHGHYEQNPSVMPYQPKHPASQAQYNNRKNNLYQPQFYTQKGSRENPIAERGLDVGQKRVKEDPKQSIKNQISEYEEKLRQLKNAYKNQSEQKGQFDDQQQNANEIVLINSNGRNRGRQNIQQKGQQDVLEEFEDNQFIRPMN